MRPEALVFVLDDPRALRLAVAWEAVEKKGGSDLAVLDRWALAANDHSTEARGTMLLLWRHELCTRRGSTAEEVLALARARVNSYLQDLSL